VVKNVAGYDLARLFCGSGGSFGVIVRASVRLHPRPAAAATVIAPAPTPARAAAAWQSLLHSSLVPAAVDLLWPGRLAILFEGSHAGVAAQAAAARALIEGDDGDHDVWDEARRMQQSALRRIRFDPGALESLLAEHESALVRPASGVAYVADPSGEPTDVDAVLTGLVARLRASFDPHKVLA
jgi:glycolate oxidase FAD binding subunit